MEVDLKSIAIGKIKNYSIKIKILKVHTKKIFF